MDSELKTAIVLMHAAAVKSSSSHLYWLRSAPGGYTSPQVYSPSDVVRWTCKAYMPSLASVQNLNFVA